MKPIISIYATIAILFLACEPETTTPVVKERVFITDTIDVNFDTLYLELEKADLDQYLITCINFDPEGTAWLGTKEQGLIEYYEAGYKVHNLPLNTWIVTIDFDSKGNVWLGTFDGIVKYDGISFSKYNSENTIIPSKAVYPVVVDDQDNVWGSGGGLVKFNGLNWEVFTPDNSTFPNTVISSFAKNSEGEIWYNTGPYLVGIQDTVSDIYTNIDVGIPDRYWFSTTGEFPVVNLTVNSKGDLIGLLYTHSSIHLPITPYCYILNDEYCRQLYSNPNFGGQSLAVDNNDWIWKETLYDKRFFIVFTGTEFRVVYSGGYNIKPKFFKHDAQNRLWVGDFWGLRIYKPLEL